MIADGSVYISEGVVMNCMSGGPADIGLYIVQTGGRSWPFIARFAREGECAAPNFAFLAPFTVFMAYHATKYLISSWQSRPKMESKTC
jgi:hypothetical protein